MTDQQNNTDGTMRTDIFSIPEGDVLFQWPEKISPENAKDLLEWLLLIQRKVARAIDTPSADDEPE